MQSDVKPTRKANGDPMRVTSGYWKTQVQYARKDAIEALTKANIPNLPEPVKAALQKVTDMIGEYKSARQKEIDAKAKQDSLI